MRRSLNAEEAGAGPMGAGDTPGDTAQGTIQLTGVLEASFGDGDHVGSAAPLPHQPRARAQPRTPPGGHTAGLGEGLGQCPKAALGGLAQATVGVFLQLVGDAPDQQIAAEPPGLGCLVKTPPFITQRGQLYRPKRRDPLLKGGHLIGPAWGHAGLGFRGHMFGPEPSAEGTHSDARLPAQVQSNSGLGWEPLEPGRLNIGPSIDAGLEIFDQSIRKDPDGVGRLSSRSPGRIRRWVVRHDF